MVDMIIMFVLGLMPIIWLIIALCGFKMSGHKAAPIAFVIAVVLAMLVWKMPAIDAASAALEGIAMAFWPIILVIIAAVFTYNLSLHTGMMEIIKRMITSVSADKRLLVLLVGWCFGGFLEGMAGFGTAIAIPASMLAGLGFNPMFSAIVCLIANSTPTAFGSIGIPTVTLANLVGLESTKLAFATTLQLAPLMLITPFIMVALSGKSIKAIKGVGLVTLISGVSFVLPQLLVAKFVGAELPVIVGSVCSLICTIMACRVHESRKAKKGIVDKTYEMKMEANDERITLKRALVAWLPFILIFVLLLMTSNMIPFIHDPLNSIRSAITIYTGPNATPYTFIWVATPGVIIMLSAFIGGLVQKATFKEMFKVLGETIKQMSKTIITMLAVLATAKVMGYSGMIVSIAALFVALLGTFYPFAAPLIGALGTFVTGSATSSSVLFGNVQIEAASAIGADPYWLAAANTMGTAAGKMLSPQSIAIGVAATSLAGKDGEILSKVIKYAIAFLIIMGFISYFGMKIWVMFN
ncbi:MAG: L-lactate permease [Erysipelotrichaceae bacterium]